MELLVFGHGGARMIVFPTSRARFFEYEDRGMVWALREFIEEGNKGRVTIMFRGREIVHPEIGQEILKKVAEAISDIGQVELPPRMEGKQMFMIVAPGKAPARRPMPVPGAAMAAPAPAAPAATTGPAAGPQITRKP